MLGWRIPACVSWVLKEAVFLRLGPEAQGPVSYTHAHSSPTLPRPELTLYTDQPHLTQQVPRCASVSGQSLADRLCRRANPIQLALHPPTPNPGRICENLTDSQYTHQCTPRPGAPGSKFPSSLLMAIVFTTPLPFSSSLCKQITCALLLQRPHHC